MDTKAVLAKPRKRSRKLRGVQFPGITADAVTLQVDRVHLFRVLKGERKSASLMARYEALQLQKKGGAQ